MRAGAFLPGVAYEEASGTFRDAGHFDFDRVYGDLQRFEIDIAGDADRQCFRSAN